MKSCPNCGFEKPHPNDHRLLGHWIGCPGCTITGPQKKTAAEAEAAWDAMPRRADLPAAPLSLEIEEIVFNISFAVNGPITFCHIVHKDAVINKVPFTYSIGSASCNPKDAFDFATGEKLAMRDACNNLDTWFFVSGQDLHHRRLVGKKLYSAYRKHLRKTSQVETEETIIMETLAQELAQ